VLDELGNAEKVRIGGLVQLTVRVRPAQKARKGRKPATGEEITIAAKPASVDLRARPLARGEGSAAVGAEGASSARRLSTAAVPPLHLTVPRKGSAPAADTRRAAYAANRTPVAADRFLVRFSRTFSAAPGPAGSHGRVGHNLHAA
jgi:Bacterial DNA-binding protein